MIPTQLHYSYSIISNLTPLLYDIVKNAAKYKNMTTERDDSSLSIQKNQISFSKLSIEKTCLPLINLK